MKELHLTMRLRNNLIRVRREQLGLKPRELAKLAGVNYNRVLQFEGLRCFPLTSKGEWRPSAAKLAEFFGCEPRELFPDVVLAVQKPEVTAEIQGEQALALAKFAQEPHELPPTPDELFDFAELSRELTDAVSTLSDKQRRVLKMRFEDDLTLEEVAKRLHVTREAVRRVEVTALRSLRGPRAKGLRNLIYDSDMKTIPVPKFPPTAIVGPSERLDMSVIVKRIHVSGVLLGLVLRHGSCASYIPIKPPNEWGWNFVAAPRLTVTPEITCACGFSGRIRNACWFGLPQAFKRA